MKRVGDFLGRGVLGVLLAYLLWLPLEEPLLTLVTRNAQSVLRWLWSPPLVTHLDVAGEFVEIRGLLYGPDQWMGRWDASNLPMFGFASMGFALLLPVRGIRQRVGLVGVAALGSFLAMLTAAVAEIPRVAHNTVRIRDRVILLDEAQRDFLARANAGLGLMEYLAPALVIALVYALVWARRSDRGSSPPVSWRVPLLPWVLLAMLLGLFAMGAAAPGRARELARFERTAALNPDFARVWLALGRAVERVPGEPGAADAYRRAIALGGVDGKARADLARILLREGKLEEALRVVQDGPPEGRDNLRLARLEMRILLALGEPCVAFRRVDRLRAHHLPAHLERIRDRAGAQCRLRTGSLSQQ